MIQKLHHFGKRIKKLRAGFRTWLLEQFDFATGAGAAAAHRMTKRESTKPVMKAATSEEGADVEKAPGPEQDCEEREEGSTLEEGEG